MMISHIIETHIHADHLSGAQNFMALTGAPIYLGPGNEVDYETLPLIDGQVLEVGNRQLRHPYPRPYLGTYLPARG